MQDPRPDERGTPRRHDHLALGRHGEDLVAVWYMDRGYEVLARNWRCAEGELDLVLRIDDVIAFCEVKTRSSSRYGSPLEAVDRRRMRRLRAAAGEFLALERPRRARHVRFDVAAVVSNRIDVVTGAF